MFQSAQLRNETNEFVPCMKKILDCTNEKQIINVGVLHIKD